MSKKSRFQSLVLGCGTKTQRDKVQEPLLKSEFGTQRDDGGIPLGRPPFEWPPPEFQKRVMQLEFYPSVVTFVRLWFGTSIFAFAGYRERLKRPRFCELVKEGADITLFFKAKKEKGDVTVLERSWNGETVPPSSHHVIGNACTPV
jgi:hypothetical protein